MHPRRMDDRAVQNTCGQPRVFNTQARARDTPIAFVAGRCLLALLASGLGSCGAVGAPSRNLEISKSRKFRSHEIGPRGKISLLADNAGHSLLGGH
jgi:hypothetical protein